MSEAYHSGRGSEMSTVRYTTSSAGMIGVASALNPEHPKLPTWFAKARSTAPVKLPAPASWLR